MKDAIVIERLTGLIQLCLSDELRRPVYRGNPNPLAGHCYVASETAWHLLGGMESTWRPKFVQHECEPHWYLENTHGQRLDITASQFTEPVPYGNGVRRGFLTKEPSRRCQIVLDRVGEAMEAGVRSPTFRCEDIGEDGR